MDSIIENLVYYPNEPGVVIEKPAYNWQAFIFLAFIIVLIIIVLSKPEKVKAY